jgi:ACS family hexuronate transporter-like MFS transporter
MRIRWVILSLLFFATAINYLDRAVLGVILPEIRSRFHFGLQTYGAIQMAFQLAYAVGSLIGGRLLDRLGTRIGYGLSVGLWSLVATLNAFAASALQFGMFRAALGLGESPNFPACNKTIAEWFPPHERASAMGVVHAGANVANIIGPPLFILIALKLGWQWCFAIMGALGFLWLPIWWRFEHLPRREGAAAQAASKLSIRDVLKYKQAWGFGWAKFFTDPVWWFYLFWLPTYLTDVRHFTPAQRATALTVVYAISGVGAIAGGMVAGFLMKRGWAVGKARKRTMLFCAAIMPACGLSVLVPNAWHAVILFGLATAAHAAWATNLFTTTSDVFPTQAVGSTNGFGASLGGFGGALFSALIPGFVIPVVGYVPVLLTMSCFYLLAWLIVHRLMGDLEPVTLPQSAREPISHAYSRP